MNKLRMAVVGAGRLGSFHAQKLAARKDVDLLAVADPASENRNRVAEACGVEGLPDYYTLLDKIDAAVIAAPTSLHYSIAREFLEAGIHLLVEKPLCATRAEADELVSIAARNKVVLQAGHVERFNPAFRAAREEIAEPKFIEAVRASAYPFRSTEVGVVLDVMIHDIDLVLSMVRGPLRKVDALGFSVLGGHEDVANARLEFECGCVASLSASRVSDGQTRRMQVWSAAGFAAIDFAARGVKFVRPSETLRRRRFDADRLTPKQVEHYRARFAEEHLPSEIKSFDASDALALEQDDFVSSVRDGRRPIVDGEAGRDALTVAGQILARIDAHCWNGVYSGPVGPLAKTREHILAVPHFAAIGSQPIHSKAG
ncbi:MAG: Gfo/Idh/MocA family oxidoreductase [Pirellulales bacterium]|nr:Gfo/Idh/MocA family oxidoreductase [Pirellulales bacterium]